jgi:hypothetical protein
MELRDQPAQPTLARKMGDVTHVSPLLRKAQILSGRSLDQVGAWLLKCAVERGASHYEKDFPADLPVDQPEISNEELGVALCLGHLNHEPMYLRAAAQLLSSPDIDPVKLRRLAEMERVEPVFLQIAEAAARFAPTLEPWKSLRTHLSNRRKTDASALPHWSRYVSQTGVTAFGGGPRIDWLVRRRVRP